MQMEIKLALHGEGVEYYWEQVRGAHTEASTRQDIELVFGDTPIRVKRCDTNCPDVDLRIVVCVAPNFEIVDDIKTKYVNCDVVAVAWHESMDNAPPCDIIIMYWAEDSWKPLITKLRAKYPTLWSTDFTETILKHIDCVYWG